MTVASELRPGEYMCVRTRTPLGWLVSKATSSPYEHSVIHLGGGVIMEATLRGVRRAELSKYANRPACVNSGEPMTEVQRAAVCARAASFAGMEYGFRDLVLIGLHRLGVRWGWLRRILSDRDAVICSELVALSGEAAYLDWLCGTTPDLVTPAMLALRPGVQPIAWPAP